MFQALVILYSLISFSIQSPIAKRAFSNGPVIASDFPDPALINVNGTYYSFATNTGGKHIPLATSPDFITWTVTGQDALPDIPSWATGQNIWAPDVIQLGNESFVMYFSATTKEDPDKHCVGTATSSSPEGPYTPNDSVFTCPLAQGGAIDAAGFRDTDGSLYVVYKVDANSLGGGGICGNGDEARDTPIMLQPVESDGVTPRGELTPILHRGDADGPLIEAPSLIVNDGRYFLFYSSNCFNSADYSTSYATASAITGPYTKSAAALLITGGNGGKFNSPGGATAGKEGDRIVFHADRDPADAGIRQMWTAGIGIEGTVVRIS